MAIGNDVLQPIPGPNPSGENLRYAAVYDKIKEARREEEDVPQGEWQIERKKADWVLVLKLTLDALTTRSKDLQLAAWATEALVHREGFAGLRQGLELLRTLLSNFWESLYPELEDGEADLRAAPLEWVGSRLEDTLKSVPLTRNGLSWFKYKESRGVGYETDVSESEAKRQARETAIADGKTTAEEFDEGLKATPKAFYQQLAADIDGSFTALDELKQVSDEKLHDLSPTYSNLHETLEVTRQAVSTLLQKKREQEPDEEPAAEPAEVTGGEVVAAAESGGGAAAAPARAPIRKKGLGTAPGTPEEAYEQVLALAQYLRAEQPCNPVPYMLVRALRWGELRTQASLNLELLVPPATELRQQLKRVAAEGQWQELLETAENAAGLPCGRGWLDMHRYAVQACRELGSDYEGIASAVLAGLKSLLADFPNLPRASLMDDTPAANSETQAWLEQVLPPAPAPPVTEVHIMDEARPAASGEAEAASPPDAYELAKQALQSRRVEEAIEILTREVMNEHCGRTRFQRRLQLAQVCMSAGYEALACPILEGLAEEIDQRKLDEWESPDLIAQSLSLLFRCWQKMDRDPERKDRLYARICRLDPIQGLQLAR